MRFLVQQLSLGSISEYAEDLEWADEYDAFAALTGVVLRLCEADAGGKAWVLLKRLKRDVPARTRALAAMAPAMRIGDLLETPAWLASLDNRYAAEPALVEVLAAIASAGHARVALQHVDAMVDPVWRAAALAGVALHVSHSKSLVARAVDIMEPLPFVEHRGIAVRKISVALAALDPPDVALLLVRLIGSLCQTLRWNFVAELNTLAPAFARAGGAEAVMALPRAVRRCARWWT
jgi:hypothetical protein